jgi:hypothetical protein
MPITPHIDLTTRAEAGAPLSQVQFDGNLTAIQTKMNEVIDLLSLIMLAGGDLVNDAVVSTTKIKDDIITPAKLKAQSFTEARKILRLAAGASGTVPWALEALPKIVSRHTVDSTLVPSTGVQAALTLSTFTFTGLPPGDVLIWINVRARRMSGANGGTISVMNGVTALATMPTHVVDLGTQFVQISDTARIEAFAGGTLTLRLEFETGEATSDIEFGVAADGRFGRSAMILAGVNQA